MLSRLSDYVLLRSTGANEDLMSAWLKAGSAAFQASPDDD